LIQKISAKMMEAVHSQDGSVQEFTGDGIMALFGAPVALEDAPLRACRAALDIQQKMLALEDEFEGQYAVRPKIRVGIHAGPLVVGEVGDDQRMQFTAVGDTVNMASRLETEAEAGTIYVSAALNSLVEGQVDVSFVGEREIKGKSEPQQIFRLDGVKAGVTRFDVARRRGLTTLIEREQELDVLQQCLARSVQQRVEIAHVVGEAGIGKSRLMHEFRQRLQGEDIVVLQGDCRADGATSAFLPFIELVRSAFAIVATDEPTQIELKLSDGLRRIGFEAEESVPYLLVLLGQEDDTNVVAGQGADVIGMRMQQLLIDLLWHSCRNSTVVLFIEDLHWIDPRSEQLLQRIAGADEELRLLLVCAFRPYYDPPWADRPHVNRVVLGPLSDEGTVKLLSERLGVKDLAAELVRLAVEKVEGNPLYAEEIARFLQEKHSENPTTQHQMNDIVLPANLQNLVMDRFDQLDESSRAVLQTAAVVGRKFDSDLIRDVLGLDVSMDDLLAEATHQDLVLRISDPNADYIFKHALVQDAVYSTLMTSQRQALHADVGLAIERNYHDRMDEFADTLAYHYALTDMHDKAVRYLAMAGRKSLKMFSLEVADGHFASAVKLIETADVEVDGDFYTKILADWLEVQQWRADFGRTIAIFEPRLETIEQLSDSDHYARIIAFLGTAYSQMSRFDEAERYLQRALSIGEAREDKDAIAHGCLGLMGLHNIRAVKGSSESVRDLAEQVWSMTDQYDKLYYRTYSSFYYIWSLSIRGDIDKALRLAVELIELGRREKYPGAVGFGSTGAAYNESFSENFDRAIEYAEVGAQSSGGIVDQLICLGIKGLAMALSGQGAEGLKLLREVHQKIMEKRFFSLKNIVVVPIGLAMVTVGEIAAGVQWIERAIAEAVAAGNQHGAGMGHIVLGEIYMQMANGGEKLTFDVLRKNLFFILRAMPFAKTKAIRHFDQAIALGQEVGMHGIAAQAMLDKGIVLRESGQSDLGRRTLEDAKVVAAKIEWRMINDKIDAELKAFG
ncbi:MAG: AAA family ATPase, partial [Proteobacteria bacterium]|nr:AAA family ATPase [Pseudomonadota bacterium]